MVTKYSAKSLDHLFADWNRTLDQLTGLCGATIVLNLHETADTFIITANLPGVSRHSLQVKVSELCLIISTTASEVQQTQDDTVQRRIDLPHAVVPSDVTVHFVDDILTVLLPKVEEEAV